MREIDLQTLECSEERGSQSHEVGGVTSGRISISLSKTVVQALSQTVVESLTQASVSESLSHGVVAEALAFHLLVTDGRGGFVVRIGAVASRFGTQLTVADLALAQTARLVDALIAEAARLIDSLAKTSGLALSEARLVDALSKVAAMFLAKTATANLWLSQALIRILVLTLVVGATTHRGKTCLRVTGRSATQRTHSVEIVDQVAVGSAAFASDFSVVQALHREALRLGHALGRGRLQAVAETVA